MNKTNNYIYFSIELVKFESPKDGKCNGEISECSIMNIVTTSLHILHKIFATAKLSHRLIFINAEPNYRNDEI